MLFWDVPDQGTWVHLHSSDVTYHYHDNLGQWYDTSIYIMQWYKMRSDRLETMQHSSSHIHHPQFIIGNQWRSLSFARRLLPLWPLCLCSPRTWETGPSEWSELVGGSKRKKQVLSCSSNLIFDDSPAMFFFFLTDHTLAHPLNCRGGVVARLSA